MQIFNFIVLSFAVHLQYRQAYTGNNPSQVQTAMDGFEDVIRRFPKCAEGYALYAQVRKHRSLSLWQAVRPAFYVINLVLVLPSSTGPD